MIIGINVNKRVEFVSKHDKSDPKTVFVLRLLTGPEQFELSRFVKTQSDDKGGVTGYIELNAEYAKALLERVIVEVKNFKPETSVSEIIESLPAEVIVELVRKATALSGITEQERKN